MKGIKNKYAIMGIIAAVLILSASLSFAHGKSSGNSYMDMNFMREMSHKHNHSNHNNMMNGIDGINGMSGMQGMMHNNMDKNKDGFCDMCNMKAEDCNMGKKWKIK